MQVTEEMKRWNMLLGPGRAFSMAGNIRFSPKSLYQATSELLRQGILSEGDAIYDPFCGSGTILYSLALYFPQTFGKLYGSDARGGAVKTTIDNLSLTDPEKLEARIKELEELVSSHPKVPKRNIRKLFNLNALRELYGQEHSSPTQFNIFQANVIAPNFADDHLKEGSIDAIICDPPYSMSCPWYTANGERILSHPLEPTIRNASKYLKKGGPIVIFSNPGGDVEFKTFPMVTRFNLKGYTLDRDVSVFVNSEFN